MNGLLKDVNFAPLNVSNTCSYLFSAQACGNKASGGISSHNGLQLQSLKMKWHQRYDRQQRRLSILWLPSFIKVKALIQQYKNTAEQFTLPRYIGYAAPYRLKEDTTKLT